MTATGDSRSEGRFERGDTVDESGGRGQPRSGNSEADERRIVPSRPDGADARPERPVPPAGTGDDASPAPSTRPGPSAQDAPSGPSSPSGSETPSDDQAGQAGRGVADQTGPTAATDRPSDASGERQSDGGTGQVTKAGTADPDSQEGAPAEPHPSGPGEPSDVGPARSSGGAAAERQAGDREGGRNHADGPAGSPAGDPGSAGRPGGQGPQTGPGQGGPGKPPRGPGGGLLMGRPFGVPVYVAPSWFLVAALITWVFGGQLDRVLPELGAARYLVSLFFAVAFYASVLVHELAHTVAALRFKLPVRRIQLQFFGGVSEIEKESDTPGREFVLAFVGPLLSLVLAAVFYAGMQTVEPGTVPGVLLAGLMISNLIVAAFNLLPGLPLDGGRMLRAVVWKITGKPMSGTVAAAWVGRALAISVLVGLPMLTQSGTLGSGAEEISGMDTVTDALLAAILAAIIWTGAGNSLRMARLREHLPELRARTLTRRAVPVTTDTPLSEALRRANEAGARALVVVDAHGDPLSVVREAAIVGVPEHRRPWVAVSGLAQELTDGMRVSAELAGEELLDALRATPATEYLVLEDTGEIYGVLSAADVERAFVKAMARTPSS
ncbi:site-2 protease family protein [Streptomyces sp. NPDC002577]